MVGRADDDEFLTRAEAAALMRLHPRTLGNLAAMKPPKGPQYMKTSMLRGRALYRRSAVIAYLEANGGGQPMTSSTATPAKRPRRRKATAQG